MLEIIKAIIIGIVEGITEWLPISSTGHMILVEEFIKLDVSKEFNEMFLVVIQLGAILAVCVIFFDRLFPFTKRKSPEQKQETFNLWGKVIVGCIPAGILGVLFNDWFDEHFYNTFTVATTLIIYGIIFIVLENINKNKSFEVRRISNLSYMQAFIVGCFQCLALVPGTSRSGATILGAMILGISRPVAAEFSFFLAAPVMFGASGLKVVKFIKTGVSISGLEIAVLAIGSVVAFMISMIAINFLMDYVRKHSFALFGYYRIILGILILGYFLVF
ncbi:Undecaprenyl-diphosphatase [Lachnospiraceae bacterium TWA4]|nr:Undecaprenyl-diphosphatase [Lachnospiraceae bacterium TWA4]